MNWPIWRLGMLGFRGEIANPFSPQTLREQLGTKPLRVGLGLGVLTGDFNHWDGGGCFVAPEARLWASAFLLGAIVAVLHAILRGPVSLLMVSDADISDDLGAVECRAFLG